MNSSALIDIVRYAFDIYWYILIIYILSSWVPPLRNSSFGDLLSKICEPYLTPFRKIIKPIGGMLDVSPIIAFIALPFIELGLVSVIDMLFG